MGKRGPAGSASSSRHTDEAVAGRYEISERLGEGASATVYRAVDRSAGRNVALKRLRVPSRSEADAVLRFRREFHTLARLRHPRIVTVYDYAHDDEGPYYTMELLDGEDLRTRAPAEPHHACRLLRDVASALAFLHARRLLHRDLAGRNVRCTSDGHAKLLDFGALATMGYSTDLVGTPPFIAPEAVRGLPLDERSDLFGLGALGYWLLTGRHAFPARDLHELGQLWQRSPPPPSAGSEGLPGPLDELVLSLLSLDPMARPTSAAEVMDRLGAIAGLEPASDLDVAQAYLRSAALIGRDTEMKALREKLRLAVHERRGQSVVVEGPSGMGRSRVLRELGLEAQLAGAVLLTGDTRAGRGRAYGLAREIVADLLKAVPELAKRKLLPRAPALARALPEITEALGPVTPLPELSDLREQQARLQSELVGCLVDVAAELPVVLLVDDLQDADEASAAMLLSLMHAISAERLLMVFTVRSEHELRVPVSVTALRDLSTRIRLKALEAHEIKDLVRSLFGEVRYSGKLAEWLHQMAGGSPMLAIELARHLVERRVVRYVEGMWVIPEDVEAFDLPRELSQAMDARIDALGQPARRLGEVLSVHAGDLPLELVARVAPTDDQDQVFAALDELVSAEVLVGSVRSYRFRHDGLREALLRALPGDLKRQHHLAMARALEAIEPDAPDHEVDIGLHYLHGGETRRAAELLERGGRRLYSGHAFADAVEPLKIALSVYSNEGGCPDSTRLELGFALVAAGYMSDRSLVLSHAADTIALAARYSGINVASRLSKLFGRRAALLTGVASAGLLHALGQRGPGPGEALRIYVMSILYAVAAAQADKDVARMRQLLALLEPASVASPLSRAAFLLAHLAYDFMAGRHASASESSAQIIRIVRDNAFDELDRKLMEGGARALAAAVPAADGDPSCLDDVEQLERLGLKVWKVAALQARTYFHLCRGEIELARRFQAQNEILSVQIGTSWQMQGWRAATEAVAYGHLQDVIGLKRSVEEIGRLVEKEGFKNFEANLELAKGEYWRERGQLRESRSAIERSLALSGRDETVYREITQAAYADTLVASLEYERARDVALETIALADERHRVHASLRCGAALAQCEAALGDPRGGARRLDELIERARSIGNPATCGALHATRAKLANFAGATETFTAHAKLAGQFFRSTGNPTLIARYERLLKAGEESQPLASPAALEPEALTTVREDGVI